MANGKWIGVTTDKTEGFLKRLSSVTQKGPLYRFAVPLPMRCANPEQTA